MGKKIWLSMHLRKNRSFVRPPIHVSQVETSHFKHLRVSEGNCTATWTFRKKKRNSNKAESFFRLNFKVYIEVHLRHTFLQISLPFQNLPSYTFYGGNVVCVPVYLIFHDGSFSPWWLL